jgi:Flp pilus assembly protein TadD
VQPLNPPDSHHLRAAQGWLELGDWREANEELERIAPALRGHPDVLEVRFHIWAAAKKWDTAAEIARELVQINPKEVQFWISHAYASRRMPGGGIPQAAEILGKARRLFPKEPLIAYNLACYDCQLGNNTEAEKWLRTAFNLGDAEQLKMMALRDPDLKPLWSEIAKLAESSGVTKRK